jgi:hypothetical protein
VLVSSIESYVQETFWRRAKAKNKCIGTSTCY